MALSASPWYAGYAAMGMMPFGLTPAEDRHLAGLIMWVPGGLVHAGAALVLLGGYLGKRATPIHLMRRRLRWRESSGRSTANKTLAPPEKVFLQS
jgi:cytochrome c oxidase assembly factor CtaG